MESQQDEQTVPLTYVSPADLILREQQQAIMRHMMYVSLAVEAVAIAVSFVMLFGLLIPLLIQLKNGTHDQGSTSGRRRSRLQEPSYSTYNLYLVYIALVDLALLLPVFTAEMMAVNQKFHPQFYSKAVFTFFDDPPQNPLELPLPIENIVPTPYTVANMCINAVITYEILILLKATHRAQRINQPSLTRANLQGGAVIFGSVLFGIFHYYWIYFQFVAVVVDLVALVYVIRVSIVVVRRGYVPSLNGSTPTDRAVRGLAFFFFRVTMIFLVIYLPSMVLSLLRNFIFFWFGAMAYQMVDYFLFFFLYLQPIITFCMVLTKPDVKKYIKDFVTLSYLFGGCTSKRCKSNDKEATLGTNRNTDSMANEYTNERNLSNAALNRRPQQANIVSIMGYTFSGLDDENNIDAQADINADDHANDGDGDVNDADNIDVDTGNPATDNDVNAGV